MNINHQYLIIKHGKLIYCHIKNIRGFSHLIKITILLISKIGDLNDKNSTKEEHDCLFIVIYNIYKIYNMKI